MVFIHPTDLICRTSNCPLDHADGFLRKLKRIAAIMLSDLKSKCPEFDHIRVREVSPQNIGFHFEIVDEDLFMFRDNTVFSAYYYLLSEVDTLVDDQCRQECPYQRKLCFSGFVAPSQIEEFIEKMSLFTLSRKFFYPDEFDAETYLRIKFAVYLGDCVELRRIFGKIPSKPPLCVLQASMLNGLLNSEMISIFLRHGAIASHPLVRGSLPPLEMLATICQSKQLTIRYFVDEFRETDVEVCRSVEVLLRRCQMERHGINPSCLSPTVLPLDQIVLLLPYWDDIRRVSPKTAELLKREAAPFDFETTFEGFHFNRQAFSCFTHAVPNRYLAELFHTVAVSLLRSGFRCGHSEDLLNQQPVLEFGTMLWRRKDKLIDLYIELRPHQHFDPLELDDFLINAYPGYVSRISSKFPRSLRCLSRQKVVQCLPAGLTRRKRAIDELGLKKRLTRFLNFREFEIDNWLSTQW